MTITVILRGGPPEIAGPIEGVDLECVAVRVDRGRGEFHEYKRSEEKDPYGSPIFAYNGRCEAPDYGGQEGRQ